MRDVFISYSSKNEEYAKIICEHLEKEGISCWYAARDIVAGEPWATAIVNAIKTTRFFVLVYSDQSNSSVQVLREVGLAASKNRYIIPFLIDDTPIEGDMEYYLQSLHWMDAYTRPAEEAADELAIKIKSILTAETGEEGDEELNAEVPLTPHETDVDADDVVQKEVEGCDILGVNTVLSENEDGETVPFSEEITDEEEYGDEEDEEDEEVDKRITILNIIIKILDYLTIFCIVALVAILITDYAYPAVKEWLDKDNMYFVKISEYGDYRYPFYSTKMFTTDLNMMFTENTETGKLALAKTDTGYPVVTGIDYKYKDALKTGCYAKEDSDIVYFVETDKKTIKIYDRGQKKWINSKGIDLKLSHAEYIVNAVYTNASLNIDKKYTDDIFLFIYDYGVDKLCYGKIIHLMSDGTFETIDISKHKLAESIGLSKTNTMLMWTEDERIKVLNIETGDVPELTHDEIVKDYVPLLKAGNSTLSPDKRFVCRKKTIGDTLNVDVWELESGKKVFNSGFDKYSSVFFTTDSKFLCFNRENYKVVEHTFGKEKKQRTLFDKNYFGKNKEFIDYPHSFYYSDTLDKCFFSSVKKDKKGRFKDKLVVTDLKGKILFQSDEFEIPGTSTYPDVFVKNDKIFYIYNVSEKQFDDGTYSIIYRATYSKDGKKITFEK